MNGQIHRDKIKKFLNESRDGIDEFTWKRIHVLGKNKVKMMKYAWELYYMDSYVDTFQTKGEMYAFIKEKLDT